MRRRELRSVLAAEVVSNFGSMLSRLAIPWFAALTLAATPLAMGVLQVADIAAGAVAGLLLAALVDRRGKRAVMLAADVGRSAMVGLLAVLAATGWLPFWMLALGAGAIGMLTVTFEMARSAWMAQRLDAVDLPAGNAQISAGGSLAETVAFALGGWLYQWLGAVLALMVDAVSYLASAFCLRGVAEIAPPPATVSEPSAPIADVRAGLKQLSATPTLRAIAIVEVFVALGMHLAGTSYMIFVARDLAFDTGTLGMIFATGGLGSLAGAALAPRVGRALGSGGALLLGLVLAALGAACIPLADATLAGAALLVAHQVIGDAGFTMRDVHDRTLRQTAVPAALLARVDGAIHTLGRVAALAGALGGGVLATAVGVRPALALAAALYAAAAVATWLPLVRRVTTVSL